MLSKEEEIRKTKERLSELKREEDMREIIIKPQKIIDFVVKFKNLSPALKIIVIFSWVVVIYLSIFFVTGFIMGVYN